MIRWLLPVAVAAAATGAATLGVPPPLHGTPLTSQTGLQLLVANVPPLLLDVDSGAVTPITGLDVRGGTVYLNVSAVGRDAVVWLAHDQRGLGIPRAEIYVVRDGATKATRLTTAWQLAPSRDGRAVWLISFSDARHCTLRELWLDGRERRRARPVPCSTQLLDSGSGALLMRGTATVDPASGRTVLRGGRIRAMAGRFALTGSSTTGLVLTDLRTHKRRRLGWPSKVGGADSQGGLDDSPVATGGRLIAVSFSDPAWHFTGTQVTDVWLLDPAKHRFVHLPDMPAAVSLKFMNMSLSLIHI